MRSGDQSGWAVMAGQLDATHTLLLEAAVAAAGLEPLRLPRISPSASFISRWHSTTAGRPPSMIFLTPATSSSFPARFTAFSRPGRRSVTVWEVVVRH